MVRATLYRIILFFTVLSVLFDFSLLMAFAQPTVKNSIVLKPAVLDLGTLDAEEYNTGLVVKNSGNTCRLSSKVNGKGSDCISVFPGTFTLNEGMSQNVKVSINCKALKAGAYDFSITFSPEIADGKSQGWISAIGICSFRMKFIKPGITIASFNVGNIEKSNINDSFHIIYANFLRNKSTLTSKIKFIRIDDNAVVSELNEKVKMNPYPQDGFYGTVKIPIPKELEMGKYIVKVDSVTTGGIKLSDEAEFEVGKLKGILTGVSTKNVRQGQKAEFTAIVKNTGNLNLNASFKVVVKDKKGGKIFPDAVSLTIPPGSEQVLAIIMDTKKIHPGNYIADYEVKYGNEVSTGSLSFSVLASEGFLIIVVICILLAVILLLLILVYIKSVKPQKN